MSSAWVGFVNIFAGYFGTKLCALTCFNPRNTEKAIYQLLLLLFIIFLWVKTNLVFLFVHKDPGNIFAK